MAQDSCFALIATLTACGAEVTYTPVASEDAGPGAPDAATDAPDDAGPDAPQNECELQADCNVGDGVHDICYQYKAYPLQECVLGSELPCTDHVHCGPFGWCDSVVGHCAAEGASACLVDWVLTDCAAAGQVCCEVQSGAHACVADCDGEALEP